MSSVIDVRGSDGADGRDGRSRWELQPWDPGTSGKSGRAGESVTGRFGDLTIDIGSSYYLQYYLNISGGFGGNGGSGTDGGSSSPVKNVISARGELR